MIDAAPSDATAREKVSFSWKQLALIESDKWDRPPMAAPARISELKKKASLLTDDCANSRVLLA